MRIKKIITMDVSMFNKFSQRLHNKCMCTSEENLTVLVVIGASVKGEVPRKFDLISKAKNDCLSTETREKMSSFVANSHPSAINYSNRLLLLSRSRVGRNGLKLEKC